MIVIREKKYVNINNVAKKRKPLISAKLCSILRWIYAVSVFRPFLLLREKICKFSPAFLYVHIRTNQTVTYWTKAFRKKFLVKGYSSILKYRHYRSYTKFYLYTTVYLVRIWTYKHADEKAYIFSRRSKNVKKRTKNGYCVNSPLTLTNHANLVILSLDS